METNAGLRYASGSSQLTPPVVWSAIALDMGSRAAMTVAEASTVCRNFSTVDMEVCILRALLSNGGGRYFCFIASVLQCTYSGNVLENFVRIITLVARVVVGRCCKVVPRASVQAHRCERRGGARLEPAALGLRVDSRASAVIDAVTGDIRRCDGVPGKRHATFTAGG